MALAMSSRTRSPRNRSAPGTQRSQRCPTVWPGSLPISASSSSMVPDGRIAPPPGGAAFLGSRPVERAGDELGVFLNAALEAEEIIIAATAGAGILAADPRARLVDGAAPGLAVEEAADGAVGLVRLVAEDDLARLVAFLGKLPRDRFGREPQVLGQPEDVLLLHRDARV